MPTYFTSAKYTKLKEHFQMEKPPRKKEKEHFQFYNYVLLSKNSCVHFLSLRTSWNTIHHNAKHHNENHSKSGLTLYHKMSSEEE